MSGVRLVVLGSSSSGNSTLVETREGALLVDAGFSCRQVTRRLALAGTDVDDVSAIVVTHEHTDHVAGVRVLARRLGAPVYSTPGTARAIERLVPGVELRPRPAGVPFEHGPFALELVPVPHDAVEPAAVRLEAAGRRMLVATDMGHMPWGLLGSGQDMDALVLESNHDEVMLRDGPYPAHLKRRILGPRGHLSNSEAAIALGALLGPRTRRVMLAHLSQRNNTEGRALSTILEGVPEPLRRGVDIRTTAPDRLETVQL